MSIIVAAVLLSAASIETPSYSSYQTCGDKGVVIGRTSTGHTTLWQDGLRVRHFPVTSLSLTRDCKGLIWLDEDHIRLLDLGTDAKDAIPVSKRLIKRELGHTYLGTVTAGYFVDQYKTAESGDLAVLVRSETGHMINSVRLQPETLLVVSGRHLGWLVPNKTRLEFIVRWNDLPAKIVTQANWATDHNTLPMEAELQPFWPLGHLERFVGPNKQFCTRVKKHNDPSFFKEVCVPDADVGTVFLDRSGTPHYAELISVPKKVVGLSPAAKMRLKRIQQLVPEALGTVDLSILNYDPRTGDAIFRAASIIHNCDFHLSNKGIAQTLSCNTDSQPPSLTEVLTIDIPGHEPISALFSRAKRVTNEAPLIVQIHGGPHEIDSVAGDILDDTLVSEGFPILRINYSGSKGAGVDGLKSIFGRIASISKEEIAPAIDYVINVFGLDPAAIILFGGSAGGYIALDYVTDDEISPKADFWLAVNPAISPRSLIAQYAHVPHMSRTWQDATDIPIQKLSDHPGVLLYGERDQRVPPAAHTLLAAGELPKSRLISFPSDHPITTLQVYVAVKELWGFLILSECGVTSTKELKFDDQCDPNSIEQRDRLRERYGMQ